LLKGTELPDAFFFAEWLEFPPHTCPTELRVLHDLTFAGYQVKLALNNTEYADYLSLGVGFGAHVAGDFAGFFPGGYLTKQVNWVDVWPLMTAVDAYVW
jgi:hypothetical protein